MATVMLDNGLVESLCNLMHYINVINALTNLGKSPYIII